jgi:prevent-host-death family protein
MPYMERVGVRDLQQHASKWVRKARAGETIEVTDRGVTVAVLAPPRRGIDAMIANGLVSAPEHPGGVASLPAPSALDHGPTLSEILEEMRSDER